jgi:ubiquinone/menaquinone biosynthesis C-methylase UbiE
MPTMSDATYTSAEYTMGYSEEFRRMLEWRSAESHATHLLPHLAPGQSLLDFGCGPGTITVGLARAVAPGELHGIDMEESQIELARAAAASGGHDNATFHVGDVTRLPFEDDTFDVAHCHTVLTHVPDTQATLKEVRRVLKPGGIVASREMIAAASFMSPAPGSLEGAWETLAKLIAANRGHPQMGKELKASFVEAGLSDVRASASFDVFHSPQDIAFLYNVAVGWFFSPDVVEAATKYGLATREQFDEWRRHIDEWKGDPGAFGCIAFGQCLGTNP